MATIKEDYVSFEVAKLLKEKGFDAESPAMLYKKHDNADGTSEIWTACTLQIAMKWLREVHQLHISVDASPIYGKTKDEKGRNTCGLLYWHYMASGEWMNEKYNPFQKAFVVSGESNEDAIEKALKYLLKNLI